MAIRILLPCLFIVLAMGLSARATSKTIIDVQPNTASTTLHTQVGKRSGFVRLTNLNTDFNIWYVLDVTWPGEKKRSTFHLENPDPERFAYRLDNTYRGGLLVVEGDTVHPCKLWEDANSELRKAPATKKSFVPLCDNRILVRNVTEGKETTTEFVADFLRRYIWGGEQLTGLVKDYLYKDKFLITSKTGHSVEEVPPRPLTSRSNTRPVNASIDTRYRNVTIDARDLGIELDNANSQSMGVGQWFPVKASAHIFVSTIQPRFVDHSIFATHPERVRKLDAVERSATVYLIAFKLSKFDLGFALGTLHPSAEWSYRAPNKMKVAGGPGPDGIGSYRPLIMVGKVNPIKAPKVVAVFAGGFKRTHGAFKWGPLSEVNQASHYGFRVNGVNFSSLQPELATLLIYRDGRVRMKTWANEDNADLTEILHARQNGVPIIEWNQASRQGIPGQYVGSWGQGNWSGSAQREQRTLRSATCIQEVNGEAFLIYGYFSSVTPNSIARVFQSYRCRYAMHLDMNGLEHTYLAVYLKNRGEFAIQYLVRGMDVLDKAEKETGIMVPRFLGTADNRDFFYVMDKD